MTGRASAADLADALIGAADKRSPIAALTTTYGPFDVSTAYEVQDAVVDARLRAGRTVVGAKLGLTSAAKQRQMHVDEPLYGWLTDDMALDVGQPLPCDHFIQPRCEPEIAFLMSADLAGPQATAAHVLAATAAVFPAIDVLDSRFAGYSFTLPDVVADNASAARFLLAGQVVIAGALTEAVPVAPGDVIVADFDRLGTVELSCR
jgi:2-oxo-3-hexenedioate decarboxylase